LDNHTSSDIRQQIHLLIRDHNAELVTQGVSYAMDLINGARENVLFPAVTRITHQIFDDFDPSEHPVREGFEPEFVYWCHNQGLDHADLLRIIKFLRDSYLSLCSSIELRAVLRGYFDILELSLCTLWGQVPVVRHLNNPSPLLDAADYPLFYNNHSMMMLVDPVDGAIIDANHAACKFYGYSHDQLTQRSLYDLNIDTRESVQEKIERAYCGALVSYRVKHQLADGEIRAIEVFSGPIILGERALLYSIIHDINDRAQIEDHLRKITTAVEHSPASIVITDRNGHIEYINQSFTHVTGYTAREVMGENPRIFRAQPRPATETQQMWQTILDGKIWRGLFFNRRKNGEAFWEKAAIAPIFDSQNTITHFVAIKEDITRQKELEDKIWHQAHHDALTDLPNRVLFYQYLGDIVLHAQRQDIGAALLFIDFDRFKEVNDSLGHEYGDLLLQQVAQRLKDSVRKTDQVARIGGDEFTVLLCHTSGHEAIEAVANKILLQLSQPFDLKGYSAEISCSIGIAKVLKTHTTETLVREADHAMFAAKKSGRNKIVSAPVLSE
jgi:diguanylate cyclase (GGDEF)-like protein/PAS domain S-box-containing protein